LKANGGIAISASHNPNEWNALKLLNSTGQFMTPEENMLLKEILVSEGNIFKRWDKIGKYTKYYEGLSEHKKGVLSLPFLDMDAIRKRRFKVVADCVNGAGYKIIPELLEDFGCEVIRLNCESTGIFPRMPEPLPENLTETMEIVRKYNADFAVIVDPDVDRLVLITEKGEPFSEENTISQAVKFILEKQKGNCVVNLSTTRAVEDICKKEGCNCFRSPVGEANVVKKMKETGAIIGGEGSGGVILPQLHYGRDALVGIAITLQHLIDFGGSLGELKSYLPVYFNSKQKVDISNISYELIIEKLSDTFKNEKLNFEDGIRIDFTDYWVHIRKSNTEPILRILTEAKTKEIAENFASEIKNLIFNL